MIVEEVDPWEDSEIAKAFKRLQSDIITGEVCRCENKGQDDGQQTCWEHHDCNRGDCTHQDGGENV